MLKIYDKHIENILAAFKLYLFPFKFGGDPIKVVNKGTSREGNETQFPYFFIKDFRFYKDKKRLNGGQKYKYSIDKQVPEAKRKLSVVPYNVEFILEFLSESPSTYYSVKEKLTAKFEREKYLNVIYGLESVRCNMFSGAEMEHELSEVFHCFWKITVEIEIDPSFIIEGAELITKVTYNIVSV